jgi:hypothetical protein
VFFAGIDFPSHWVGAGRPCAFRSCGFNRRTSDPIFPLWFFFSLPPFSLGRRRLTLCSSQVLIFPPTGSAQADLVFFAAAVLTAGFIYLRVLRSCGFNRRTSDPIFPLWFFFFFTFFPGPAQADLVFFAGTDFPSHWVGAGRPCAFRRF